jgi:glutamate racemase
MAKFAIMGYGTLGSGLAHVAHVNHDSIAEKAGEEIAVKYILDIRDFEDNPYQHLMIKDFSIIENDPEVEVVGKPCPLFVPLVEEGRFQRGDIVIETVAREYLEPLKELGIDTLILGCTHYPLLTEIVAEIMGPDVTLVSAGEESAFELKRLLKANGLRADESREGEAEFFVSDRAEDFERIASVFLQEDLRRAARRIDIDQY